MHTRLAVITALALAHGTQGALFTTDWQTPGDGLLTIQPNADLVWLDWSVTSGESYFQVLSELGPGGDFEGFRHATEDEIRAVFVDAGALVLPLVGTAGEALNAPAAQLLVDTLGTTFDAAGAFGIYELAGSAAQIPTADGDLFAGLNGPRHVAARFALGGTLQPRAANILDTTQNRPELGHALVFEIPSTGAGVLLVVGLAGLAARRRSPSEP